MARRGGGPASGGASGDLAQGEPKMDAMHAKQLDGRHGSLATVEPPADLEHDELPELPWSVAMEVQAELAERRRDPPLGPAETPRSDFQAAALRGSEARPDAPRREAGPRRAGVEKARGRAEESTLPASKRLRTEAPQSTNVERDSHVAVPVAQAMLDDFDPCDEDPFGHVQADLARQPPRARDGHGDGQRCEAERAAKRPCTEGRGDAEGMADAAGSESMQLRMAYAEDEAARGENFEEMARGHGGEDGAREDGDSDRTRPFGRRYTGLIADPVDAARAEGHALRITGPIIFCDRCGRYATRRVGKALKASCSGQAAGAYCTRLARLRSGLHPLTALPLV